MSRCNCKRCGIAAGEYSVKNSGTARSRNCARGSFADEGRRCSAVADESDSRFGSAPRGCEVACEVGIKLKQPLDRAVILGIAASRLPWQNWPGQFPLKRNSSARPDGVSKTIRFRRRQKSRWHSIPKITARSSGCFSLIPTSHATSHPRGADPKRESLRQRQRNISVLRRQNCSRTISASSGPEFFTLYFARGESRILLQLQRLILRMPSRWKKNQNSKRMPCPTVVPQIFFQARLFHPRLLVNRSNRSRR